MTGGIEWKALLRPSRSRTYPSPAAGNAPFMIVLLALLGIFAVVRGVVG
ncbi:MAG: hypothetical protein ACXV8L_06995 [Ilumatobacteraceae bacterium]